MNILSGIDLPGDLVCGSFMIAQDIYEQSRERGDDVRFFVLKSTAGSPLVAGAIELDVAKSDGSDYVNALRSAIEFQLAGWSPDVIHLHHLAYGMAQALSMLPFSAPRLAFAHGTDVYDAIRDEEARSLAGRIAKSSDQVVFPTVSLVRDALESGIQLDPRRVVIAPWGVPDAIGQPEYRSLENSKQVIVASRFTANKDIQTVVEAAALLPPEISVSIIGEGRERETLLKIRDDLALEDKVMIEPMMPRVSLWRRMRAATVAVFPTRETEAFGLFGVECQVQGLPVITSDLPVFGEVFGGSVERFRAGDPADLARVITSTVESDTKLRVLSAAGLVNARRYQLSSKLKDLLSLSDALVSRK
ncbi:MULTISPECIES: glycosyltransferase family 4 protein [unclassified Rathayibacter]|uniref:glycosyltransferase family 4 protein n=1 Tax=unclassified Rathayibacter TaxID=2609250 RepID=UPI0011CD6979|nr:MULTISPECIES: glycosyltransferase family 4 protein [unclassified Rathayibacter]